MKSSMKRNDDYLVRRESLKDYNSQPNTTLSDFGTMPPLSFPAPAPTAIYPSAPVGSVSWVYATGQYY